MPHTLTHSQTTEYRATQLVSSIKFKLSDTKAPTDLTFRLDVATAHTIPEEELNNSNK